MSTLIVVTIAAAIAAIIAVAIVATRREGSRPARVVAVYPRGPVVIPGLDDTSAVPVVIIQEPCREFCGNLAEVGDPRACGCGQFCGRNWCPRKPAPTRSSGAAA